MVKFLREALFCFVVLLTLAVGAVAVGRIRASPYALPELQVCGTGLCVLGIKPQSTTLHAAQDIIRQRTDFKLLPQTTRTAFKQTPPFYTLNLSVADEQLINEIDLNFTQAPNPTAGVIIAAFGQPCLVLPQYIASRDVLIYPGMMLFFTAEEQPTAQRFDPNRPVVQIQLLHTIPSCEAASRSSIARQSRQWRGFVLYAPLE